MKRRSMPDPEHPDGLEADLAAKLRARYVEAVDPALEARHLSAMTAAFQKAESTRPLVAAGHRRETMSSGFLASTTAKIAAAIFAGVIATGTALAATGNLDVLPATETADDDTDDDLTEPGNADEVADSDAPDEGDAEADTDAPAETEADPTPSPTPTPVPETQPAEIPEEPANCDEADTPGEENDDENDPEDGLEGIECDDDGAAPGGTGTADGDEEEDVD